MDLLIGGSANYFCVVIIIVKYRISCPKKLKTIFEAISAQFYPLLTTCTTSVPLHEVSQAKLCGSIAEPQVSECCYIHVPLSVKVIRSLYW